MPDWYVSEAQYNAIALFQTSHAYVVGDLVRPTAPSTLQRRYVQRCTTAGTSAASEPGWSTGNNALTTSGTAQFTNVSGQSTYGWTAAAGSLYAVAQDRVVAGDRVFVASDHADSSTGALLYNFNLAGGGYGLIQLISVNRAGSVPPVAADIQNGAALTCTAAVTLRLEAYCNLFVQGFTLTAGNLFDINSSATKQAYLKDCAIVLTSTGTPRVGSSSQGAKAIFDNTTVQFAGTGEGIGCNATGANFELLWINTPNAIQGATIPTTLFGNNFAGTLIVTCRGVDLSAATGTLLSMLSSVADNVKVLLDSCKIASGVTRFSLGSSTSAHNEIELVNCFDGTNIVNERHGPAGSLTFDKTTYVSSGAEDDVGHYSHKLASNVRSDICAMPLDSFWLDVENTVTGSSKTATVEIVNSVPSTVTLDGTPVNSATVSNGGLTLTHGSVNNAGAKSLSFASRGKFYFEVVCTLRTGLNHGAGVGGIVDDFGNLAGWTYIAFATNSLITSNGVQGPYTLGNTANGDRFGVAIDLDNRLAWFRKNNGNWNGTVGADPVTRVSGAPMLPFPYYFAPMGRTSGLSAGDNMTFNFGATAYVDTPPTGFGNWDATLVNQDVKLLLEYMDASGSPVTDFVESVASVLTTPALLPSSSAVWTSAPTNPVKQQLQATFTPQRAGRVRGRVQLGKPNTTIWVNPQMTIT